MWRVRLIPVLILAGLALVPLGLAIPATAAELVTPYPAVRVEAGQTTTFDLEIHSEAREPVGLRVTEAPDGWETVLRGGGSEIDAVYANPGGEDPATAQLEVTVPGDAATGDYNVTVAATADSGNATLNLQLRVVEQAANAFELTTEFPTLRGTGTDTFRFDLPLTNRTSQEATFSLTATGPERWTVTTSPSAEQQAATVTVEAGATATVTVEADPPDDVAAGTYEIGVQAAGAGTTLEATLGVEVTGATSFTLATADEVLSASGAANETGTITLVVTNDSNAPLQNVAISATPPTNWTVEFEPETLPAVAPGESAQVRARITPAGDAIAGDYAVTLNASTEGGNENLEIRYAVKTSGWWGLVGILVILVALAALYWVYQRYGRR